MKRGKGAACILRTTHPPTLRLTLGGFTGIILLFCSSPCVSRRPLHVVPSRPLGGFTGIALLYSRQNGLIIAGSFAVAVLGMYGGAYFQVG